MAVLLVKMRLLVPVLTVQVVADTEALLPPANRVSTMPPVTLMATVGATTLLPPPYR